MKPIFAAALLATFAVGAHAQASAPMAPMPAASGMTKPMAGDKMMKKDTMKGDHMKSDKMMKKDTMPKKTDKGAMPASGAM